MTSFRLGLLLALVVAVTDCGTSAPEPEPEREPLAAATGSRSAEETLYPDVVAVEVSLNPDGTFRFDVTLSSPYDTPQRYADAWRVRDEDGTVYGIRELVHDHANEQPFTRSLDGVEVPPGVTRVVVEGRDQLSGWGGKTLEVDLPGRDSP